MTVELLPVNSGGEEINPPPAADEAPPPAAEKVAEEQPANQEASASEQTPETSSSATEVPAEEPSTPVVKPKAKGRPKGSKNRQPRPPDRKKRVQIEEEAPVEPLSPVREEPPEPEPSPRAKRIEWMKALSAHRVEQKNNRVAHYTSLLDKMLSY